MSALIALAKEIGAPLVRKTLEKRIGTGNAHLAETVVTAIADRLGQTPGNLDAYVQGWPDEARHAVEEVERALPDMLEAHELSVQLQTAEMSKKPGWISAWRPVMMYLIGFLWAWALVILHVANAIWKIALPPVDLSQLLALTALYLSLYMGGHTVKEVAKSWGKK